MPKAFGDATKCKSVSQAGSGLLHFRDEQEVKYNIAGAKLQSGHLLLC
jgi:hypothetical protein